MDYMTPEERFTKIENTIEALTENQARNESAIHDLIVVSRTVLTAIDQLQTAQKHTNEKLSTLIDTVDRTQTAQKHTDEKLNILINSIGNFFSRGLTGFSGLQSA